MKFRGKDFDGEKTNEGQSDKTEKEDEGVRWSYKKQYISRKK